MNLPLPELDCFREAGDLIGQLAVVKGPQRADRSPLSTDEDQLADASVLTKQARGVDELMHLHPDHVFSRREALEHGYSDADLQLLLRAAEIVRIRHGAYVNAEVWSAADNVERHRLRAHAVLRSHGSRIALSHTSAAVEHGLRLFRPDLRRIHVTCLGRPIARTTQDVVYHQGGYTEDEVMSVGPHLVMAPVRAGLEAASLTDVASGMVILDSVVDQKLGTLEEIHAGFERFSGWPNSRRLQITVRLSRKGANSVGESLARHLMWTQRLPEPVLQFEVRDDRGNLIGVTDFAWPEAGVLGEFDGMIKYGRLLRNGETPGAAVEREKKREDRLREETGWLMIRLIWAELFRPGPTAARVRRQLERGKALIVA